MHLLSEMAAYAISTAITPRKIIAGVVLLIIIVAIGMWWARRQKPTP
ncbi:MAG TPA: hypothetical protein VET82_12055 [Candidatus Eisenbacteria bacterium]|jgi:hypothetical protein|nr:hypothetical protein [Candidatus Eisenbacteria bacterium]